MHSASSAPNPDVVDDADQQQTLLPKPDINQMIPYKPKVKAFPGEHPIPGMLPIFSPSIFFIFVSRLIYNGNKSIVFGLVLFWSFN